MSYITFFIHIYKIQTHNFIFIISKNEKRNNIIYSNKLIEIDIVVLCLISYITFRVYKHNINGS
jgi:1-acyl-sn-glycerol-3-phosphate acyltransferase